MDEWKVRLDMNSQNAKYLTQGSLNGLTLKNRLIKAATFEGMTPSGTPGEAFSKFHTAIAKGGVAMTTFSYCAPEPDGRLHENMMYMHEGIRAPLSNLISQIHKLDCKVSGQLAHCGGFSRNRQLQRKRPLGPSFALNTLGAPVGMPFADAMNLKDIELFIEQYAHAAAFMKSVGFDCIEIHFGHGYGLCQFISPLTNRRTDEYGGSLANRMRLPLQIVEKVREAVGDDFPVIGKISLSEGARGGLQIADSIQIAQMLDQAGIDGLVTSGGTSTRNPMMLFRGESIAPGMIKYEKNPLIKLTLKLFGSALFKEYPYEELYFLEDAKKLRDHVNCKLIYVGGASNSNSFATLMDEGFDFIQLGRTLLSDPDMPVKLTQKPIYYSPCNHCNDCVGTIEHPAGVHCPRFFPQDPCGGHHTDHTKVINPTA